LSATSLAGKVTISSKSYGKKKVWCGGSEEEEVMQFVESMRKMLKGV